MTEKPTGYYLMYRNLINLAPAVPTISLTTDEQDEIVQISKIISEIENRQTTFSTTT